MYAKTFGRPDQVWPNIVRCKNDLLGADNFQSPTDRPYQIKREVNLAVDELISNMVKSRRGEKTHYHNRFGFDLLQPFQDCANDFVLPVRGHMEPIDYLITIQPDKKGL
jgi:hypothetical protein